MKEKTTLNSFKIILPSELIKSKKTLKLFIALFGLLVVGFEGFAQTYNMGNGTFSACAGNFYDSGGSGGAYGNSQNFTQTICSSVAGQCVSLNFSAFDLESGFDFLDIYDGPNTSSALIGSFTGTTSPGIITATSGCITLVFSSDGSVTSTGFAAAISCAPCLPAVPNYNMGNGTISACGGNFYDSGGSGGAYGNSQTFTQTICSSVAGQCASLSFTSFNLESGFDFLSIYNGTNASSPLIGTYTGTNSPGTVTATTGCLTLVFTSDIIVTAPGFAASISCQACPSAAPCTTSCNGGAPPANDACAGAQNLGNLPTPPACPANNGVGPWTYFNTTNLCATAEQPYTSLLGCQSGGNMPSPATDVWYMVNITGPTLNINITGLQSPSLGIYAGTNCTNLVPRGCANGVGGTLNTTFGALTPGTYFLQISGGNLTDQCNFTLGLQNNNDCNGCVIASNLTATPPPINGTYQAGQTVTFCYTISDYNQTSANWLHGVIPTFGSGWNLGTLSTSPVTSCSGQGTWNWYNNTITSSATGSTYGPGFFFESGLGSPSGFADGNPGNNFGDNNPLNACDWTFCWTLSTPPPGSCVQGASLNMSVNTLGDGESGSWGSLACTQDASGQFFATLSCCTIPTFSLVQPLCAGQNTGSATVTLSNDPPWDYVFTNSTGTTIQTYTNLNGPATVNNLSPGTYIATVTTGSGCVSSTSFTIVAPPPIALSTAPINVSCFGLSNGSLSATPVGGAAPYQYVWSGSSSTTSTAPNLAAGSYNVTVTDANGCTANASGTITQPTAISANATSNSSTCSLPNGSATVNPSGGTPGYVYSLNGGASQPGGTFNSLAAGNYSAMVTDSRGCTITIPVIVSNQPGPIVVNSSSSPVSCNGGNNGTVTLITSGGTAPVQYSINGSPLQANNSFSGLTAGTYTVTATDANGCTVNTTITVATPSPITANSSTINATCSAANGSLSVVGSGGASSFTYSLNGGANGPSGTFNGLGAGSYNVTITDANGCTLLVPVAIGNQLAPAIISTNATPVSCFGGLNGSISVSASGGTGAITYTVNGATPQPTGNYSGLSAGSYTVTATDANGCSAVSILNIVQPTLLTAASSSGSIACFGGTTSVAVSGGGGTSPYSGTGSFTIGAGSYSYTVTDANGCTAVTNISIAQPTLLTSSATPSPAACNGTATGSVVVSGAGGTAPYAGTGTFSNLAAGSYAYTVTDANGCTSAVNATVTEPTLLTAASSSGSIACFGGTTSVSVSGGGGTSPYSGTGSFTVGAGSYSYTVTDANGCTAVTNISIAQPTLLTSSATPSPAACNGTATGSVVVNGAGGTAPYAGTGTFSNLSAGSYSYTVTDANGCTAVVNATVTEPTLLTAASSSGSIACFGGTTSVSISGGGGTSPYSGTGSFTVGAGSYSYTVTDANGCTAVTNISIAQPTLLTSSATPSPAACNGTATGSVVVNGAGGTAPYAGTGTFSNLAAGSYAYTVTDANGCTSAVNATVTEPTLLTAASSSGSIACFGGTTSVSVSGGGGTSPYSGTGSLTVGAGSYSYTVTDANGCTAVTNISIAQPTLLTSSATPSPAACNGTATGSVVVNGAGGTAPYAGTGTFSNLSAGSYSYTVTDANGCTTVVNATVTEPTLLTAASSSGSIACFGGTTSVAVSGGGGTAPLSGTGSFTVGAGSYSYTVTDANGCTAVTNISIAQPTLLTSSATPSPAACNGTATGSVVVNGAGGTAPYAGTGTFSNLSAGSYSYTITDANGCTSAVNATVTEPTLLTAASSSGSIACFGGTTSVAVSGGGGTAPLSGTGSFTVGAGTYSYTVTDANGCTAVTNISIAQPTLLTSSATPSPAACNGTATGSVVVNGAGGTAPYAGTGTFSNLAAGSYAYTVTDANGCTSAVNATVTEPTLLTAASSSGSIACFGGTTSVAVSGGGGTAPLSGTGSFTVGAGSYSYTVTDANGCTAVTNISIAQPTLLTSSATPSPAACNGTATGSVVVNGAGGTAPYAGTGTFSNLSAGSYSYTVTDANGCTTVVNATVTEPTLLTAASSSGSIACFGGTTSVAVSGGGGTAPLSGTGSFTVGAGSYSYTVTDANGCTALTNIVIAQPTLLTSSATPSPASCNGTATGSVVVNGAGGTAPYAGTGTFSNLSAGSYSYTVTDANGCTSAVNATVAEPTLLTAASSSGSIACFGGTTSVAVSGGGGTAPLSGTGSFTVGAGSYSYSVTDANGCTAVTNINIAQPALLISSVSSTAASCGNSNGSISVSVNGGISGYSYSINNGASTQSSTQFNNLLAGNYTILVTDANGCTTTNTVSVSNTSAPTITSTTSSNNSCFNSNNGSINIVASGGSGVLQYSINNGSSFQPGNNFSNLVAGTYNLIVEDALGCQTSAVVTITQPAILTASSINGSIACNGGSTTINVSANGGTSPYAGTGIFAVVAGTYSYVVTDANGCTATTTLNITQPSILNVSSTPNAVSCFGGSNGSVTVGVAGGVTPYVGTGTFNNLSAGTYSYTVTDANGCTATTSATILQPTAVVVSVSTQASTCGNPDGSLSAIVSGGTGPYLYNITSGGSLQSSNQFNNLFAGPYSVTIQDANGCTSSVNVNIANQAAPAITNIVPLNATCSGVSNGSVMISANGGTGSIQYSINNGGSFQGTGSFSSLGPGNYQVLVTDVNGCTAVSSFTITQPAAISASTSNINTTCSAPNGSISINAQGGTPAFQYSFNNGITYQNASSISSISAGTYNLVVTDANGCSFTTTTTITDSPSPAIQNISTNNISCNGAGNGSASINTSSGTSPLGYTLNSGSSQASGSYSGLLPGSYTLLVTDANGCTATSTFSITQPAPISATYTATNSTCGNSNGTFTIAAQGGTGGLSYSINNGISNQGSPVFTSLPAGAYNVLITDANGCTGNISTTINNNSAPTVQSTTSSNITCSGLANGTISVVASGGTGILGYSINGGPSQSNGNFNGLGPGIYTITVNDANGCVTSTQATITQPSILLSSGVANGSTCNANNGSINISAQGGTTPYNYSLNAGPSQTGSAFGSLVAGTYQVLVSDANGCTSSAQVIVTGAPGPVLTQGVATNVSCNGLNNGSIQILHTGGTVPIQYSINGGSTFATNPSFINLAPGPYSLLITDANGCTSTSAASISQPTAINLTASTINSTCGNSDGSISLNASGGTSPYQYSINNGTSFQPIANFPSLPAGPYSITVTDANGCSMASTAIINNAAAPTISNSTFNNVTCFGSGNGSISVAASGGTSPLVYSLNGGPGQTNGSFNGLTAGIYNVIITDANGCTISTLTTITEPSLLTATTTNNNSTCGNSNGGFIVNAGGGTAPFQFSSNGGAPQSSNTYTSLAQGIFNIVVTDQNGCTTTTSANITNIAGPTIAAVAPTDISCNGLNNGQIIINSLGGAAPLQYSINNGSSFSANNSFSNLAPGNYSIVISDGNGCTAVANAVLAQPPALSMTFTSSAATCGANNGSFTLTAAGGVGPYQFSGNGGASFQPSGLFSAMLPGNYNTILTDANGCQTSSQVAVANSAAPLVTSVPVSNVTCNGMNNGTIDINVNGGTSPITYSINGGFTSSLNPSFNNLAPGSYQIVVTDANGCTSTSAANITQPAAITLNSNTTNASCGNNDGSATIIATGGNGTITYTINGGSPQSNGVFANLGAGNYSVVVTDQSGCTGSTVASVSNNAAPIISNVNGTNVICSGNQNGSISIAASGGSAPLSYSINNGTSYQASSNFLNLNGGTYPVSVLDANGCLANSSITITEPQPLNVSAIAITSTCGNANGGISSLVNGGTNPYNYSINNGATTQPTGSYSNLAQGPYTLLVTDNNGCTSSISTVVLSQPGPVAGIPSVNNVSCFGFLDGSITVNITGGTTPMSYNMNSLPVQTNNYFGSLGQGAYNIVVTDANGCTATASANVTAPAAVLMTTSTVGSTCGNPNGSINLSALGGIGPYQYSNNAGLTYQSAANFSGLPSGMYQVSIADVNGCTASDSAMVTSAPGPLVSNLVYTDVSCYGGNNGTISLNVISGTSPLNFSLNAGLNQTNSSFNGLFAGAYNILVTDANGCTYSSNQVLTQPAALSILPSSQYSTCFNGTNGSASVAVNGGSTPYNYVWSNGITNTSSINNLTAGSYSVTITDNNGCTTSTNMVVANIAGPSITNLSVTNNTCYQSGNGSASIQITGGSGPFIYTLNGAASQSIGTFTGLTAGTGSIVVIDNNGCSDTSNFNISEPVELLGSNAIQNATCGNSNGSIAVSAVGGTQPYSYSNNGGVSYQTIALFSNVSAGAYSILVMDANGCTVSMASNIVDLVGPVVATITPTNIACNGGTNGSISIAATGNGPLTYSINNGASNQSNSNFTGLGSGSFSILVTDTNGCTIIGNAILTEPDAIIGLTNTSPSICDGAANGSASIAVQGGVSPYNYMWSNGLAGQSITNVAAGPFSVIVTDANGCTMSMSTTINNIATPIITSMATTNASCFQLNDGTLSSQISGGVGPYNYELNGALQSNGQFAGLLAGNYQLTITDANGCLVDSAVAISEPSPLFVNPTIIGSICSNSNGTISLVATGGTAPYQYSNNNGVSFQSSNNFGGLIAGNYQISIQDANGCSVTAMTTVADAAGPVISNVTPTNASCNGYLNGSIGIATSGGTSPISFQVNNGTSQPGNTFNNLPAGSYLILVTDANGCTSTSSSVLTQPQPITINANGSAQLCIGQTTNISAYAAGGNGGYVFTWSNGAMASSQTVAPITSTVYTVSVTDSLGCPAAATTISVGVNPPLQLVISPNDTICEGQTSIITALATGGDGGPYTYNWSGMSSTAPTQGVSPIITTSYSVSVTDGCTTPFATAVSQVIVNPLPAVDFYLNPHEGCAPLTVDFTNLTTAGAGAQYVWNFGDNNISNAVSPTHIYFEPGTYSVSLKAETMAGCSRQIIFPDTIHVWPVPSAQIITTPPVASAFYPVIQFQDGGFGSNTWNWDFGDGSPMGSGESIQHTYEVPNIYDVTLYVENLYGCRDTAYTRVTIEQESTLYVPNAFTPNGDGINDLFSIYGIGISSGTMTIYNRWGQLIYSTDEPQKGWNGQDERSGSLCQIGVYVYRIDVTTYTGVKRTITGRVTLAL